MFFFSTSVLNLQTREWYWSSHLIFQKCWIIPLNLNYIHQSGMKTPEICVHSQLSQNFICDATLFFNCNTLSGVCHTWWRGMKMRHPAEFEQVQVTWLLRCLAGTVHQLCVTQFVCPVDGIQRAAGQPAVVHRHHGRPLPSPSRLLPGPPGDREDGYHQLPGENNGFYEGPGDPSASRKRHGRQVTEGAATVDF